MNEFLVRHEGNYTVAYCAWPAGGQRRRRTVREAQAPAWRAIYESAVSLPRPRGAGLFIVECILRGSRHGSRSVRL